MPQAAYACGSLLLCRLKIAGHLTREQVGMKYRGIIPEQSFGMERKFIKEWRSRRITHLYASIFHSLETVGQRKVAAQISKR